MDLNATAVLTTREVRFAPDGSGSYSWDVASKAEQIEFGPNGIMTLSLPKEAVDAMIDGALVNVDGGHVSMRDYIKGFALQYAQAHPDAVQFQRLSPVVVQQAPAPTPTPAEEGGQ